MLGRKYGNVSALARLMFLEAVILTADRSQHHLRAHHPCYHRPPLAPHPQFKALVPGAVDTDLPQCTVAVAWRH